MRCKTLGRTGLKVSEIGLGCAQLGGPSLRDGALVGSPAIPESEALLILKTAYESGINFFDTSACYGDGKSEELLGKAFQKINGKVVIATKCGMTNMGERCFTRKFITSSVEESLKRLRIDCIDILQLKGPNREIILQGEVFKTLSDLKSRGLIRFSGISVAQIDDAYEAVRMNCVDTLQVLYNLLHLAPEDGLLQKANEKSIGIICRSPLSSGLLTGRITETTRFRPEDDRNEFMYGELLKSRVRKVREIQSEYNLNGDELRFFSLNYLLSNEAVSTVIPGASSVLQLQENLKVLEKKPFNTDLRWRVKEKVVELNKRWPL